MLSLLAWYYDLQGRVPQDSKLNFRTLSSNDQHILLCTFVHPGRINGLDKSRINLSGCTGLRLRALGRPFRLSDITTRSVIDDIIDLLQHKPTKLGAGRPLMSCYETYLQDP